MHELMHAGLEQTERVDSLGSESERRASGPSWLVTSREQAERVDNIPPSIPFSLPPFLPPNWGHFNVPQQYSNRPKLGSWVYNQIRQYRLLKSGMKYLLSNERLVQLDNVSFQQISDSQLIPDMAWNEHFHELLEFKQRWGHYNVPTKYAQCTKLGNLVSHQRQQYRNLNSGKKSLISNERIMQLENVTFQWISDSQLIRKRPVMNDLQSYLSSNKSGCTVMLLRNILNVQSLVIGWGTR